MLLARSIRFIEDEINHQSNEKTKALRTVIQEMNKSLNIMIEPCITVTNQLIPAAIGETNYNIKDGLLTTSLKLSWKLYNNIQPKMANYSLKKYYEALGALYHELTHLYDFEQIYKSTGYITSSDPIDNYYYSLGYTNWTEFHATYNAYRYYIDLDLYTVLENEYNELCSLSQYHLSDIKDCFESFLYFLVSAFGHIANIYYPEECNKVLTNFNQEKYLKHLSEQFAYMLDIYPYKINHKHFWQLGKSLCNIL